jgi:hypothetical protein
MTIEEIRILSTDHDRIVQAYLAMANAGYRPAAPDEGLGSVDLNADEIHDQDTLRTEAKEYAKRFLQEEASLQFYIGCSNYETNRALVYVIEAARLFCCSDADTLAVKLLGMAIDEAKKESSAFMRREPIS